MLPATGLATISQIANPYQTPCCIIKFVTVELRNVTTQDYVININDT